MSALRLKLQSLIVAMLSLIWVVQSVYADPKAINDAMADCNKPPTGGGFCQCGALSEAAIIAGYLGIAIPAYPCPWIAFCAWCSSAGYVLRYYPNGQPTCWPPNWPPPLNTPTPTPTGAPDPGDDEDEDICLSSDGEWLVCGPGTNVADCDNCEFDLPTDENCPVGEVISCNQLNCVCVPAGGPTTCSSGGNTYPCGVQGGLDTGIDCATCLRTGLPDDCIFGQTYCDPGTGHGGTCLVCDVIPSGTATAGPAATATAGPAATATAGPAATATAGPAATATPKVVVADP